MLDIGELTSTVPHIPNPARLQGIKVNVALALTLKVPKIESRRVLIPSFLAGPKGFITLQRWTKFVMKCQYCEKPATFHITELTEPSGPAVMHLCEEHARNFLHKENASPAASIAGALAKQFDLGQTKAELAELDQKECPVCGISFFEFRNTGRLGCPYDYKHFEVDLKQLLNNIHESLEHVGKRPKRAAASADSHAQMIQLRREMEDAIEREDYERASEIRDELKKMEETESVPSAASAAKLEKPETSDKPKKKRASSASKKKKSNDADGEKRIVKTDADLSKLARSPGEWLRGTGPESDIVISSRIRLARNLADFPFIRRCGDEDRLSIERTVRSRMEQIDGWSDINYVDIDALSEIDRQFLVERQLISREIADADGSRGVAIDPNEQYSVMVNEEDHLRIQVMHSGLDLQSAWKRDQRHR